MMHTSRTARAYEATISPDRYPTPKQPLIDLLDAGSTTTERKSVAELRNKGSLVKCGIAECGMRKVKCGIEKCGNGCGMVGKMRNAERVKWRVNLSTVEYRPVKHEHDDNGSLQIATQSVCDGALYEVYRSAI